MKLTKETRFGLNTLAGGEHRWLEKITKGNGEQFRKLVDAANTFAAETEDLIEEDAAPADLDAAFERVWREQFALGGLCNAWFPVWENSGRGGTRILSMLEDVWERGPAMRAWFDRRFPTHD